MKPPADQSGAVPHAADAADAAHAAVESVEVEPAHPADPARAVGTGKEPTRTRRSPVRRLAFGVGAVLLPVVLGGCGLPTFWGYRGATQQAHDEFLMYAGTFIAAIVVGGLVTLLMIWAMVRYRRNSDEMPRQFQYHGAVEVLYTVVPIVIVLVIFGFTVVTENNIDALSSSPAVDVKVTAFQWGWEFAYPSQNIVVLGHTTQDPDLVLPSGETSQITLVSQDVIHGFYVPEFNFSRYAQPGVTNQFDLTPKASSRPEDYRGQCTQLCGLYHALMFFHVTTLPPAQFQAWLTRNANRSFIGPSSNTAASATGTLSGTG
ncbi:MAG: cytochrome c oxidase subunit II [Acidimicrobiales bacterium]